MSGFKRRFRRAGTRTSATTSPSAITSPLHLSLSPDDLPPVSLSAASQPLSGHDGDVLGVAAFAENGLIVTATRGAAAALRTYSLDGDGCAMHVSQDDFGFNAQCVAALGADVLASGGRDGIVSTWRASTGERLESIQLEAGAVSEAVSALAVTADTAFVASTSAGALVFFAHEGGCGLRQVGRGRLLHDGWVRDVAVRDGVIVTASNDRTAAVWNAEGRVAVGRLRGHEDYVRCAGISDRFIATGSDDATVRLYENGGLYPLARVLEGLHSGSVRRLVFLSEDMLMTASYDETAAFTSLSAGKVAARVEHGICIRSAAITPDGRLACVGMESKAAVVSLPAIFTQDVENYVAAEFPTCIPLSLVNNKPLQSAMVDVSAGNRSAGDACRALVTKENCSRSIEEWWCAHRLLMAAVERGEVPAELHCGEGRFHWFLNLYTPSRCFSLGPDDWAVIKQCVCEAQEAGVISEPEAVLAAVVSGQDLLEEVGKLQRVGQSMLAMLSKVFVMQAKTDAEMEKLGKEMSRLDRVQKINALLTAVFSFAPLGGAAAANTIGAVAEALPLLESLLGTGVGVQGAVFPFILDRFVSSTSSMISLEGWESVAPNNRVAVRKAAETLGMSWGEFCDMILKAAARRVGTTDDEISVGRVDGLGGRRIDSDIVLSDQKGVADSYMLDITCHRGELDVAADSSSSSSSSFESGDSISVPNDTPNGEDLGMPNVIIDLPDFAEMKVRGVSAGVLRASGPRADWRASSRIPRRLQREGSGILSCCARELAADSTEGWVGYLAANFYAARTQLSPVSGL